MNSHGQIFALHSCFVILCSFGILPSCSKPHKNPSSEKAWREKARLEAEQKIASLETEYRCTRFPPEGFKETATTYELQKLLQPGNGGHYVFRAVLRDIYQLRDKCIAEFICDLRDRQQQLMTKTDLVMRLVIAETDAKSLAELHQRDGAISPEIALIWPDSQWVFFVVATLDSFNRQQISDAQSGEAVTDTDFKFRWVATGTMIKWIPGKNK